MNPEPELSELRELAGVIFLGPEGNCELETGILTRDSELSGGDDEAIPLAYENYILLLMWSLRDDT